MQFKMKKELVELLIETLREGVLRFVSVNQSDNTQ